MNVYDQAHQLATAIKESEECKQFNDVRKKLEANPDLDSAIKDFMKKQFEFQASQMMGQEVDPEEFAKLQQLSAVLMQDPLSSQYFNNQMRFSQMMSDVYKIIGDVADFGIGPMGNMGDMQ
ncbi:MAG: YlbF family regulator [Eubacteriales bacterium]|nr:YlbF family regulator [Eubacteriales bacterium]